MPRQRRSRWPDLLGWLRTDVISVGRPLDPHVNDLLRSHGGPHLCFLERCVKVCRAGLTVASIRLIRPLNRKSWP